MACTSSLRRHFGVLLALLLLAKISNSKRYGPFHIEFGANQELKVSWFFEKADQTKDGEDTAYITLTLAPEFSWMTFGFMEPTEQKPDDDEDPIPMDFVFVYSDAKGRIKFKDCVTTSQAIVFDKHKDYFLESNDSTDEGINVTIYRKFDTGDRNDVRLQAGIIPLVHCYGKSGNIHAIRKKFPECRDMTDTIFVPDAFYEDQKDSNDVRSKMPPTHMITSKLPSPVISQQPSASVMRPGGDTEVFRGRGRQPPTVSPVHTRIVIVKVAGNCTASPSSKSWYDVMQVRENSIYYAIIGTSALLTGIIVLLIGCCCARSASAMPKNSMKSKVAFYKVDDYEDEHVEFLKENS